MTERGVLATAAALALAAAVGLGLSRFAYALLLPPMRADLGWSYFTAGLMNTANAAGYLIGALLAPGVLARLDARAWMLAGGVASAVLLPLHGAFHSEAALLLLRLACGVASAASFVGGGLLAARLAQSSPARAGLVLGIFYAGVGAGITAASLLLPPLLAASPSAWAWGWVALGLLSALTTAWLVPRTRALAAPPARGVPRARLALAPFAAGLAAYTMFGLGYIGYMTFVVTLLRQQGMSAAAVAGFYALLGLGAMASPWLWARLLQHQRGGVPMALLNALLAVATVLPVLSRQPLVVAASVLLFGAVFLSVVASTTALVRHNAPPAAWPAGIAAFTIVFAFGQIVGPVVVGWIADGAGGLERGFVVSAVVLALGAALALAQRPLPHPG